MRLDSAKTGWPWLAKGWALHCHAGQFPPGKLVTVMHFMGMPMAFALCRPVRAGTQRGAIAKWPAHAHPERQRLYSSQAKIDRVMLTTEPFTPERAAAVDEYFGIDVGSEPDRAVMATFEDGELVRVEEVRR